MKIALGTVQFGLDYGISNNSGKVNFDEVEKIMTYAKQHKIELLDTAIGYGVSEDVIGLYNKENNHHKLKIITKIPDLNSSTETIARMLDNSLVRLSCEQVYALLFHKSSDIDCNTYKQLTLLKDQGKTKKIGVSVYSPEQAFYIASHFDIDLIQLPLNVFDQRFIESGCLEFLKSKGIEIHARSLFLQGLLLQPLTLIDPYFRPHTNLLKTFSELCLKHKLSALDVTTSLVHSIDYIDKFVIGVCSQKQLAEILKSYDKTADIKLDIKSLSSKDESLINPSLWKLQKT
jgi:aryl-alcohol dehydrogenase-like predicted oxidoreductase